MGGIACYLMQMAFTISSQVHVMQKPAGTLWHTRNACHYRAQDAALSSAIERSNALNRMELLAGWEQTNYGLLPALRRQLAPYAGERKARGRRRG